MKTTAVVLSLSPAASFWLASQFRCRGQEVTTPAAVVLAVTTGIAAYIVGDSGDSDTIALVYTLNFMLGSGWLIASRYCSRIVRVAHSVVTLVVIVSLMHRLQNTAPFYLLLPILAQFSFLVLSTTIEAAHIVDKSFIY